MNSSAIINPALNDKIHSLNKDSVTHVFVCGLHRSGTTILAQQIAQMRNCTGFGSTGAGIFLDEGQYLQDVYPPDTLFGGVGRFGFNPKAHLTECSPLLTSANVSTLRQSWENHWDISKPIRVEKTPSNLLKTRFLQAAFPGARFIVIRRHPVAVSLATQKWSRTPLHDLFEHWLWCHEVFDRDKSHLQHLYEVSYEDYVSDPNKHLGEIADFIGTDPGFCAEPTRDVYNTKYLERWTRLLLSSPLRLYYCQLAADYELRFARYGYSLAPLSAQRTTCVVRQSFVARAIGSWFLFGWQIYSVLWRAERRCKNKIKWIWKSALSGHTSTSSQHP